MTIRWNSAPFPVAATRSLIRLSDGSVLGAHTHPHEGGVAVFCVRSRDQGRTWKEIGLIASDPEPDTDLGDGSLIRTRKDGIFYTYRHNRYRGKHAKTPDYAIRVAASRDGVEWRPHSTVTEHTRPDDSGPSQGFWAPFLLETPKGRLQCYFDDEKTPLEAGFRGHQWLMSRTWDARSRRWIEPVVVSRAHDPNHLSRDGMGTVIALPNRQLLCALESVQVTPPHANVARMVLSDDDGRTWNWTKQERGVLYEPKDRTFAALSPCMIRLSDGNLVCIFCTDEEEEKPNRPGNPPHLSKLMVKVTFSKDNGRNWSSPESVSDSHTTYLPGIVELASKQLLAVWVDFSKRSPQGRTGQR